MKLQQVADFVCLMQREPQFFQSAEMTLAYVTTYPTLFIDQLGWTEAEALELVSYLKEKLDLPDSVEYPTGALPPKGTN